MLGDYHHIIGGLHRRGEKLCNIMPLSFSFSVVPRDRYFRTMFSLKSLSLFLKSLMVAAFRYGKSQDCTEKWGTVDRSGERQGGMETGHCGQTSGLSTEHPPLQSDAPTDANPLLVMSHIFLCFNWMESVRSKVEFPISKFTKANYFPICLSQLWTAEWFTVDQLLEQLSA